MRAPRGSWRLIVGVAVAALIATQLLPAGHPLRPDLRGSMVSLFWIAVVAVPVAAYALLIRQLRRRSGADRAEPPRRHPVGLVRIAEDAALSARTQTALDAETGAATGATPQTLSLAWRAPDGALAGHLRLRVAGALADIETLRVGPAYRGAGIGTALVTAAAAEAREHGAAVLAVSVAEWQAPGFFAALGFDEPQAARHGRHRLEKPLA